MITRIRIKDFKSLEDLDLRLGSLNLFIGTNSSGKSNFLDALRVLQGIGNGFTLSEVLNGKPRTAISEIWDGIRGGSDYATFRSSEKPVETVGDHPISFEVNGRARISDGPSFFFHYYIAFQARAGRVIKEWLSAAGRDIFDSQRYEGSPETLGISVAFWKGKSGKPPKAEFERSRPVISQFADYQPARVVDRRVAAACSAVLADLQRLDPAPDVLRSYSSAHRVTRMGEHGENFAALVNNILAKPEDKAAYLEWLKELSPADVDDVLVLPGALGEPLFAVKEGQKIFPAPILSDGTLRFAAITAAFFEESVPALLLLEEIEKGVHPNRLRLLVELLKSQSSRIHNQVIATTHSPDVLDWLDLESLQSTFVASRNSTDGASVIRSVGAIPAIEKLLSEGAKLSELFSEGWLETVA